MSTLREELERNWKHHVETGFVLGDADAGENTVVKDPETGFSYAFRRLLYRKFRGDAAKLRELGVTAEPPPGAPLFRDPREPTRPCFLCWKNIALLFPRETLVPLGGLPREVLAAPQFAPCGRAHHTIVTREHEDQRFDGQVLELMIALQAATGLRVLFNGPGAGASTPYHFHVHVVDAVLPVERIQASRADAYPTALRVFDKSERAEILGTTGGWLAQEGHTLNVLVAPSRVCVFPRDVKHAGKGRLVGAFEVSGLFILEEASEPATLEGALTMLASVNPPSWSAAGG